MGEAETSATKGDISWLVQEDPALFSQLAEKATHLVFSQSKNLGLRDDFKDLVDRYNLAAGKAGMPTYVAPAEIVDFAKAICTYFFMHRQR